MKRLLIGISGSLGVLSIPSYLVWLKNHFSEIKIIMTHSATQLIPKETIALLCREVYSEEFPLTMNQIGHIELARWAEIFIVLPATAHLLSQVAIGAANTLLTATILAYRKKVIFFPNMNAAMWENKAVQRNVLTIQEDGHQIVSPQVQPAFESASKIMEKHPVMPEIATVLSLLKAEASKQ